MVTVLVPIINTELNIAVKTIIKSVVTMSIISTVATVVLIIVVPVVTISKSIVVGTSIVTIVVITVIKTVNIKVKETVKVYSGRGNFKEQKARAYRNLESGNNSL